ncbi:methyltransferase domain-containing protein [Streptomyces sp. NPDC048172]|uniref:methyltransferase domain-containing protein n=1 Tax=Streptomyces sp. NPDC048172 TaxID=3365505 RepID=UPI0037210B10
MSKDQHTSAPFPAPPRLVELLDRVDAAPEAEALRRRSYELLGVRERPGARVLDVGCGTGRAVGEMAGAGARAEGADTDAAMLALARERWPGARFHEADALQLPYGDGTLDGYRADKLYHALPDPAAALAEARRVLAPGRGRVCLLGHDWDAFLLDADDPELTRALVRARSAELPFPRAARGYRNLLLDAGFQDVHAEARTWILTGEAALPYLEGHARAGVASGAVTAAAADRWHREQRHRATADRLFLALPFFMAAGRAPTGRAPTA